jgi:hypothetical protein
MGRRKIMADQIAARRGRIAAGRLRGMTLTELAASERIDKSTVCRDLQAIRQEWRAFRVESMEQLQNQTAQRYDVLLHAIWDRAEGGDLDAIDTALRIEASRRRLLHLDTPREERRTVVPERRSTTVSLDTLVAGLPSEVVVLLGLTARVAEVAGEADALEHQAP